MPLALVCPQCRKKLNVPDQAEGRKVKCPGCSHIFVAQAAAGANPQAGAPANPQAPARPSQVKGQPAPRPTQVKTEPTQRPSRPSQVKPETEGRLSELKLEDMPGGNAVGNDLNSLTPTTPPAETNPVKQGKQTLLRVIVFLLCAIGAASCGLLSKIWLDVVAREKQQLTPEALLLAQMLGGEDAVKETLQRMHKLTMISYLLMAAAVLAIVCGVRAFRAKGLLPGLVLLVVILSPLFLLATVSLQQMKEKPVILIFFMPLVFAGLICLLLRERSPGTGKLSLGIDLPLAIGGLAVVGVAAYVQLFPSQGSLGADVKELIARLEQEKGTDQLGDRPPDDGLKDRGRPKEKDRPKVVNPPMDPVVVGGPEQVAIDADIQQLVKALANLDVGTYRTWLSSDPGALESFEQRIQFSRNGRNAAFTATEILHDFRAQLMSGHARRTPGLLANDDEASVFIVIRHEYGSGDYYKLSYRRKQGSWKRVGIDYKNLNDPLVLPVSGLRDLFPANMAVKPFDGLPGFKDEKLAKTPEEARALLKQEYPDAEFNDQGQLVSFKKDFVVLSGVAQAKAFFKVLSPAFQDKQVRVMAEYIDDADLARLAGLSQLDTLRLNGSNAAYTEKGLAGLKNLTNLKRLEIKAPAATDGWLSILQGMTGLEELKLQSRVTDAGLAHLAGLTGLTELSLGANYIQGPGLAQLEKLSRLRSLDLARNSLTGTGLQELASLPDLSSLDLAGNSIDDAGLKNIAGLRALHWLVLADNVLTGAGLASLRDLPRLNRIVLARNRLTGVGLEHLNGPVPEGGLTIDVDDNPLEDAGIAVLADMVRAGIEVNVTDELRARVRQRLRTDPHLWDVNSLVFAPDGNTLVSGGSRSDIKLWDAATRKVRDSIFADDNSPIRILAFSSDGRLLAANAGNLFVWNVADGKRLHRHYTSGSPRGLVFLAGDKTLLLGSESYGDKHQGLLLWGLGDDETRKLTAAPYSVKAL
ncbi:MAG: hypothetical protein AB7K24_09045, partial [Gemmataceae bacterium]